MTPPASSLSPSNPFSNLHSEEVAKENCAGVTLRTEPPDAPQEGSAALVPGNLSYGLFAVSPTLISVSAARAILE